MATLSAQIQDLVGSFTDETALDQWLKDGVRELVNVFPSKLKEMCYSKSTFTSVAAGSEAETIASQHLGSIYAGSVECRKISASDKYKASDSGRIDYATSTDPVYYVEGGKLNILPASLSGTYYIAGAPSIDADSDSAIASFPDEAEHLVVLYASIKALQQQMNTKQGDLPSDVVVPVLETISESLPTWSAPSDFVVSVKPAVPTISSQVVADPSSFAPTYTKPVMALQVAPTISDLSITAVSPDTPSLASVTFASIDSDVDASLPTYTTATVGAASTYTGSAPNYSKLTTNAATQMNAFNDYWTLSDFGDSDPGELTVTAVLPSAPTITAASVTITGTAPTYTKPVLSLRVAPTISDLSITAVKPATLTISSQSISDPSSYAPTYTKPSIALKVAPTISDLSITAVPPDVPTLSSTSVSFSTSAPTYDESIGDTEIGEASTALDNEDIELASARLNEAQVLMSQESSQFNEENIEYQAQLQISIQDAQFDNQEDARKLQKFSAEVQEYQAEVNTQVQEYQQNLAGDLQVWQTERQTDLQKYSTDIQNELNEYNKENAKYQAILQEYMQEAQLLDAHEARKIQKYQSEVQTYQAEVNTQVQEYQQNLQGDLQVWQAERQTDLQKYGTDVQNELNEYNKENTEYQAKLQKDIQDAQLEDAEESKKLQKYQAEVGTYSAQVNKEVQEYGQKFSRYQLELNTVYQAWAKTESDRISALQADISDELNDINIQNTLYQSAIQESMQEIQVANQVNIAKAQGELQLNLDNENRSQQRQFQNAINDMKAIYDNNAELIQKYQAEASIYQMEVTTQVQEYQQNLAGDIQVWQAERSTDLQKYGSDLQNELNEYNKENAKYQAILQEYIQEAQLLDAHEARKLQKYQAEVGTYSAELNANVQVFTQALAKNRAAFDTSMQKYTSEVQKVASANQSKIQVYTGEVSNFTQLIQKQSVDYQWLQGQYAQLKADYQQGLQLLMGGGTPPPQQQQGR